MELVILIKDTAKQIMNIVKIMIKKNLKNILFTLIWIIYMDMQWVNIYHMLILNGSETDKTDQKLMQIKKDSSTGYILEEDLEYPQELHDIHNDYPLAPEKINIPKQWLSDYSLEITNAHNITTGTVKKLVPNLMNKNNYVIHYRNLQQCLELGMKLKKIHRIIKFKQSDWVRPLIHKKEWYQIMKLIRISLN